MRVPDIALYGDGDYDETVSLIESEGYVPPGYRAELSRGLALVARNERDRIQHDLIGFIWALAADGNPVAYLDYFVVRADMRGTNVGPWLLGTMAVMLRQFGVKKMVGSVPQDHYAYRRMLRKKGARDLGLHHIVELDLGEAVRNGKEDDDYRADGLDLPADRGATERA